ncbi:MAG: PmeII family type II restriction endonuclease [Verrucomicrobiia bacterium]
MPLNTPQLEKLIEDCLTKFYDSRLLGLQNLSLKKILKKKNPYLYRALGVEKASEIVEEIMRAHVTSSGETIFGNVFFEPIARAAAGGRVAAMEGGDVVIEYRGRFLALAVKSGPNWGNADQHKRQSQNFDALRRRLYKLNKRFDPLVGQSYGQQQSEPTENSRFRRLSGQIFWQEITGDKDFYLKLIRLMRDVPAKHKPKFKADWDHAVNRFTREFMDEFCQPDGAIDWEKLVQFNSSAKQKKRKR